MKHAEFENDVIQIVARVTKKDAGTISHDTNLVADLGIDSGSAVVLLVELEDAFDVTLSDRAAAGMRTVGDILDYLRSIVKPA
jgi:acyl carrier protein